MSEKERLDAIERKISEMEIRQLEHINEINTKLIPTVNDMVLKWQALPDQIKSSFNKFEENIVGLFHANGLKTGNEIDPNAPAPTKDKGILGVIGDLYKDYSEGKLKIPFLDNSNGAGDSLQTIDRLHRRLEGKINNYYANQVQNILRAIDSGDTQVIKQIMNLPDTPIDLGKEQSSIKH